MVSSKQTSMTANMMAPPSARCAACCARDWPGPDADRSWRRAGAPADEWPAASRMASAARRRLHLKKHAFVEMVGSSTKRRARDRESPSPPSSRSRSAAVATAPAPPRRCARRGRPWLVRHDDVRIGDDGACDRHPLLLPPDNVRGECSARCSSPTTAAPSRRGGALALVERVSSSGSATLSAPTARDEVEELEDQADVPRPPLRELVFDRSFSRCRRPSRFRCSPVDADTRFSSVDLPEPDAHERHEQAGRNRERHVDEAWIPPPLGGRVGHVFDRNHWLHQTR